jgi:hypothetical protein
MNVLYAGSGADHVSIEYQSADVRKEISDGFHRLRGLYTRPSNRMHIARKNTVPTTASVENIDHDITLSMVILCFPVSSNPAAFLMRCYIPESSMV